jgi:hypothetical protein
MEKQRRIINFVTSCLKDDDFINFITQDDSEIKEQITSVIETLLKGICVLQRGKKNINLHSRGDSARAFRMF